MDVDKAAIVRVGVGVVILKNGKMLVGKRYGSGLKLGNCTCCLAYPVCRLFVSGAGVCWAYWVARTSFGRLPYHLAG
jgi:hypothetical protein